MSQPLISVIVPIYNVEKTLPRCLESLINQTFKEIEIICVIDGSPDNSLEICMEYKKNESRLSIISQENQGRSGARNTGIQHAKGLYIQFCDPDDYYAPDMCYKMYNAIKLSDADLIVAGIRIIYDQVDIIHGDYEYYRIKNNGLTIINEAVIRSTDVSVCNKLFKKSLINAYGINFPLGLLYEDACFYSKYLLVSKTIFFLPDCLYTYIRQSKSIMTETFRKTPRALEHVKILEDIHSFLLKHDLKDDYETDIFLWLVINFTYFVIYHGTESVFDSMFFIVSHLLKDIPDIFITTCPYVYALDRHKLLALKNNDKNLFFQPDKAESKHQKIKSFISPFFPVGSKRRAVLKKIYIKMQNKRG